MDKPIFFVKRIFFMKGTELNNFIRVNIYKILIVFTVALYILTRVDNASSIVEPKMYPDSRVYLSVANSPITVENYWLARVPIVIPLVYKLFGGNTDFITNFQTGFSMLSWIVLGLFHQFCFSASVERLFYMIF